MTSTQRSESANHMLKGYVPASCPMHLFVRQYMRLLSYREANENYEERRTKIVAPENEHAKSCMQAESIHEPCSKNLVRLYTKQVNTE